MISRYSSFSFRGKSADVDRIARELRVRYVVEGSIRRVANRVRVNAKLIDAELGNHIWAERYDRTIEDVFAVQDEIALAVTSAINPIVDDVEQWRAARKHPESLSAWEAYQTWTDARGKVRRGRERACEGIFPACHSAEHGVCTGVFSVGGGMPVRGLWVCNPSGFAEANEEAGCMGRQGGG